MKNFKNTLYYLSEVKTILKINGLSTLLSLASLVLIFFVTLLTLTGWWLSHEVIQGIKSEAEVSVYFKKDLNQYALDTLKESIEKIEGVNLVTFVTQEEAYEAMASILGEEAKVLNHFNENPFEAYYEIGITLEQRQSVLEAIKSLQNVESIRDNREILDTLERISRFIMIIALVLSIAVGVTTFIITSHIIREGVNAHRDQINTLQLLGAPNRFIRMPFLMEGTFVSVMSGVLSVMLYFLFIVAMRPMVSGVFPFWPLINMNAITQMIGAVVIFSSMILGVIASVFGLNQISEM